MSAQQAHPAWIDQNWSEARISRFAGGRRRHNAARADAAKLRRYEVTIEYLRTLASVGPLGMRGVQSRLAKKYSVHRGTVSRDITRTLSEWFRSTCSRRAS